LALALATAAPLIAAPRMASSKPYEGPAGLKWGQTRAEVRAILEEKFEFQDENPMDGVIIQAYTGEFAGEPADAIGVFFIDDKLVQLAVVYPSVDSRPASKRWEVIVQKMTETYGAPTAASNPPKGAEMSDAFKAYPNTKNKQRIQELAQAFDGANATLRYQQLDAAIVSGSWEPKAQWTFDADVRIEVSVRVDPPDEYGQRTLRVVWLFNKYKIMAAAKAKAPRDF